jgi:hypothetical protein
MRLIGIAVFTILVCGCSLDSDKTVAAAERQITAYMPVGESLPAVRLLLDTEGFEYQEISIKECAVFYIYAEYKCEGGPSLRLLLSEDAHPWSPFYSPSMHAFLAFDADQNLSEVVVRFEGGN